MALLQWKGPTNALILAPESPRLVYTDRVRATDIYMGTQMECAANMLARGTFGSGARAGWVVNQCTCETQRGTIGKLTIEWEAGGSSATQPLPVGNFSLQPQELYPKVERNPFFAGILATTVNIVYSALQSACNASGAPSGGGADATLVDQIAAGKWGYTSGNYATQLSLAQSLLAKLMRGTETYYVAGWRYSYEAFSYTQPTLNEGGSPGTPGGPLSASLPSGVDWLRLADQEDPAGVAGSMYKITINYLGGPGGFWDTDLY